MSITIDHWLENLADFFLAGQSTSFAVYIYEGTIAEIRPTIQLWHGAPGLTVEYLDVALASEQAGSIREARALVDSELKRVAGADGNQLVVIDGLNLMHSLYPEGILQPIHAWLRTAGRAVLLILPPSPTRPLPSSARLADWRSTVRLSLGIDVANKSIVKEGILSQ